MNLFKKKKYFDSREPATLFRPDEMHKMLMPKYGQILYIVATEMSKHGTACLSQTDHFDTYDTFDELGFFDGKTFHTLSENAVFVKLLTK